MITLGFVCGWSGVLAQDTLISFPSNVVATTYLIVDTTGGNIVYKNAQGVTQVWPGATPGLNPIAAIEVLSSATIGGIPYTTTANVVGWAGSVRY